MPLRLLYLGLPVGLAWIARKRPNVEIVAACVGHPGALGMRRVRHMASRGTLVLAKPNLENEQVQKALSSPQPEIALSFFWPRKIPKVVLELPKYGAFGTHPSLLPRWRGPDPYFWAIRTGDPSTGVTLHRLDGEYDTGRIIEARALEISNTDDAWTLARRLDRLALELLLHAIDHAGTEALEGRTQSESDATWAPRPTEEDLSIDWNESPASIVRLVRAAAPNPGALAALGEEVVDVLAAEETPEVPRALLIAESWKHPRGIVVRAGIKDPGGVLITKIRDAAGVERTGEALHGLVRAIEFSSRQ